MFLDLLRDNDRRTAKAVQQQPQFLILHLSYTLEEKRKTRAIGEIFLPNMSQLPHALRAVINTSFVDGYQSAGSYTNICIPEIMRKKKEEKF